MARTKDMGIHNILNVLAALKNGEKTPYQIAWQRFKSLETAAEYTAFCLAAGLIEPGAEQTKKVYGIVKTVKRYRLTENGKSLLQLSGKILRALKNQWYFHQRFFPYLCL